MVCAVTAVTCYTVRCKTRSLNGALAILVSFCGVKLKLVLGYLSCLCSIMSGRMLLDGSTGGMCILVQVLYPFSKCHIACIILKLLRFVASTVNCV